MAGKWAKLKDKLDPKPGEPIAESYRGQVDLVKAELAGKDTATLSEKFEALKKEKEDKDMELGLINAKLEAVSQLLIDRAIDLNLTALPMQSGIKYLLVDEPHTSGDDKSKTRQWFIDNGQEEILSPPWQTLNAIVKGKLEAGADPDEVAKEMGVKIFMKTTLQRRKH